MMHVFDDTLKENEKNKKNNIVNDRDITNGKNTMGREMTSLQITNPNLNWKLLWVLWKLYTHVLGWYPSSFFPIKLGPVPGI